MHLIRTTAVMSLLAIASLPGLAKPLDLTDLRRFDVATAPAQTDPAATPGFNKLAIALSGDWWVSVKYAPDKKYPDGQRSTGTQSWHLGPGGMPLVEQFHTRYAGGSEDSADSALIWRDDSGGLRGMWCASINDHGCTPLNVEWQGDKVVMSGEYTRKGHTYAWREEFNFDGAHKFTQQLFQGEKGKPLTLVQTVSGERQ